MDASRTTGLMTPEQLAEQVRASGENAEVYRWDLQQLPEDQIRRMDDVQRFVLEARQMARDLRTAHPDMDDATLEAQIRTGTEAGRQLSTTHPRILTMVTTGEAQTSDAAFATLMDLIALRRSHETPGAKTQDEQTQEVSDFFKRRLQRGQYRRRK